MDATDQIFNELSDCDLTETQIKIIGEMIYDICEEWDVSLFIAYDESDGIRIILLDDMEQLGASIYDDELELLNQTQNKDVMSQFINELKIRFS